MISSIDIYIDADFYINTYEGFIAKMNKSERIILICIICCSAIALMVNLTTKAEINNNNQVYLSTGKITIRNFAKVDDCYYRGGQPNDTEFKQLASLGVKTVINLRHPFNFDKEGMLKQKAIANNLGMKYINIPMIPTSPPSNEQINYYFSILNNPDNLPVFVHDREGKDREGLMVALYRIKCYHWTYDQAYSEMRAYGYHRFIYPRLKNFLYDYRVF